MTQTLLMTCDRQQTLMQAGAETVRYTAYGHRHNLASSGLPGFNGEWPDALTGHYLLGNGYRAYNPVLRRFHNPDSWSPFGRGGMNAYAYCLGDPVNLRDPSGHFPWQSLIGVAGVGLSALTLGAFTPLAVTGMLLGTAALAVDVARETGGRRGDPVLSGVGLVLGGMSVAVGLLGVARLGARAGGFHRLWSRGQAPEKVVKLELQEFKRVSRQVSRGPSRVSSRPAPEVAPDDTEMLMEAVRNGEFVRVRQPSLDSLHLSGEVTRL